MQVGQDLGLGWLVIDNDKCQQNNLAPRAPHNQCWPQTGFALAKLFPAKRRKSSSRPNSPPTLIVGGPGDTKRSQFVKAFFTCEICSDNSSSCNLPGNNFASKPKQTPHLLASPGFFLERSSLPHGALNLFDVISHENYRDEYLGRLQMCAKSTTSWD